MSTRDQGIVLLIESFTTTYVMAEDGKPASTKSMRAWVQSELENRNTVGPITSTGLGGGVDYSQYCYVVDLQTGGDGEGLNQYPNNYNAIFDGDESTGMIGAAGANKQIGFKFVPPKPIQVDGLIEIKGGFSQDENLGELFINDVSVVQLEAWNGDPQWFSALYEGLIYSIRLEQTNPSELYNSKTFGVNAFKIDGEYLISNQQVTYLEFASDSGFDGFAYNDRIEEYDADGNKLDAFGVVGEVAPSGFPNRITLLTQQPNWDIGSYVKGPLISIETIKKYLKLDQATLNVIELQSAETPYTPIESTAPKITFGATLGTADTPDDLLPPGTSIQTEIKAANGIDPDSIVKSNLVTPISVTGPNATMYGLRFDSSRGTKLSRAGSGTGTISYWKKDTGTNPQWEHEYQTGVPFPTEIGAGYDGYMSDFYFVEGAEPADGRFTFVEDFEGKIGPRDFETDVKDILTFGTNGFYLPFDPGIESIDYTNTAVVTPPASGWLNEDGRDDVSFAFDGDVETYILPASSNENYTIEFLGGVPVDNSLEILGRTAGQKVETNLSAEAEYNDGTWTTLFRGTGTFTSITMISTGNRPALSGIRVDGNLLVDHGTIGYDASGNDNHFTDENFEFGDGTMYSDGVTSYGKYFIGSIVGIFDGDLQNGRLVMERLSGEAYIKWTGILEDVSTLSVYTERTGYVELKGNLGTATQNYSLGGTITEVPITAVNLATVGSTITEITVHYVDGGDSSFVYLYGIERNGRLLVNASLVDTVFDTPMKNYAVLETGYNGNLQSNSVTGITYLGEANTDYYYEEDGESKYHEGGTAFSSVSGKTYNFGQQPFADNREDDYNGSENWSAKALNDGNAQIGGDRGGIESLFDGSTDTYMSAPGPNTSTTTTFTDFPTGSYELWVDLGGTSYIETPQTKINAPAQGWMPIADTALTQVTQYQGPNNSADMAFFAGVKLDGEMLVDADIVQEIKDAKGNNLFQTWAAVEQLRHPSCR